MPGLAGKGWGIKIFKNKNLYWIDAANSLGIIVKIYIDIGYIRAQGCEIYNFKNI